MTRIVTGQDILENAREICRTDDELVLAVSYWGKDAADYLGLRKSDKTRIVLNVAHGGTNPAELQVLADLFPERVRVHSELHAKIYASRALGLIGSANASSNGLQGGHKEAGVVLVGEAAAQAFAQAETFYEDGKPLSDEHIEMCKHRFGAATLGERMRPAQTAKNELDTICQLDDLFGNVPLILTDDTVADEEIQEEFTKQQNEDVRELQGDYNEGVWDYCNWRLSPQYLGKKCLSIHRSSENAEFQLRIIEPVKQLTPNAEGTFAYMMTEGEPLASALGIDESKRERYIAIPRESAAWERLNAAFQVLVDDGGCYRPNGYQNGRDLINLLESDPKSTT